MRQKIVKISPFAQEDLFDIWEYISFDNEEVATEFITQLRLKISKISEFPFLGVRKEGFTSNERFLVFKKYNIYYRIEEEIILIRRVLHGSREIKNYL